MCTLYNIRASRAEIAAYFEANDAWRRDLEKDYVASNRPGYVVRNIDGARQLETMKWGFPPPAGVKGPVVNVRNLSSSFWRTALLQPERRCLVPATSFSEWNVTPDQVTGKKTLHWFNLPSRPIFALAGIWRPTETGATYAFLTCEPNPFVGDIHPKAMPVILHDEDHQRWLTGGYDEVCAMAQPYPSQLMAVE